MNQTTGRMKIEQSATFLGIELGSTRIKAVLVDGDHHVLAVGSHTWENQWLDGVWTYSMDQVWNGIQSCYASLADAIQQQYQTSLTKVSGLGISAMMHGYLPLNAEEHLLVPFRTWRNNITGPAATALTKLLNFNIPQRWSIAHLYQAMLNEESHVTSIAHITTLAGYVHWKLTGERVLGIGDASGMFPIDDTTRQFNRDMMDTFDTLHHNPWQLQDILPRIASAGDPAGVLSEDGARLLDPTGQLQSGIPMCPPEGDAGTGMIATHAIRPRTGNISAGTSMFAMTVLDQPMENAYPEVDMVTTPAGDPVAMVHCNNGTGDLDAWIHLLGEAARLMGAQYTTDQLYSKLLNHALQGQADGGGLLSYNYLAGEHIHHLETGRPLFVRTTQAHFTLENFMRTHLYAAVASLRMGMNILMEHPDVYVDFVTGHGGFFKQAQVGMRIMSAALETPVQVMEYAGEGGPWGMAVLAAYRMQGNGISLIEYLLQRVFQNVKTLQVEPDARDVDGFRQFLEQYEQGLSVQREAVNRLH